MVTNFLTIDHVLSSDPQVLARVIPTTERAQGLLGTVSKCNNIKIDLTMKEKCYRPISPYKELTFVNFGQNP
jgi:hypothetical protein